MHDLNGRWYDKIAVGKDTLGNVMKSISEKAKLSQIYTNHCICHSVIDVLDENNFEARHIMAHTGHKSESSIRQYASKCPPKKRREMSECLAKSLTDPENVLPEKKQNIGENVNEAQPSTSIIKSNENAVVKLITNPDINWLEMDTTGIEEQNLVDVLT